MPELDKHLRSTCVWRSSGQNNCLCIHE